MCAVTLLPFLTAHLRKDSLLTFLAIVRKEHLFFLINLVLTLSLMLREF